MTREEIREKTMQLVYQMDIAEEFDYEKLSPIDESLSVLSKKQAVNVLEIIRDHISEIDETIFKNTSNWSPSRIAKADLAILRTAVAEMLFCEDVPRSVSINEAVELGKKYGDEKSYAFINSVLSKVDKANDAW
ncbi:MAG: transcription antitermination factor NusB [Clostridiales bacterium]|nr:transcription antitermination factor NusB [Candidatus Crickella caballi]